MALFDKTGTLTKGCHRVTGVASLNGDEDRILALAGAVASDSEHPLAQAIRNAAQERGSITAALGFQSMSGRGVEAATEPKLRLVVSVTQAVSTRGSCPAERSHRTLEGVRRRSPLPSQRQRDRRRHRPLGRGCQKAHDSDQDRFPLDFSFRRRGRIRITLDVTRQPGGKGRSGGRRHCRHRAQPDRAQANVVRLGGRNWSPP